MFLSELLRFLMGGERASALVITIYDNKALVSLNDLCCHYLHLILGFVLHYPMARVIKRNGKRCKGTCPGFDFLFAQDDWTWDQPLWARHAHDPEQHRRPTRQWIGGSVLSADTTSQHRLLGLDGTWRNWQHPSQEKLDEVGPFSDLVCGVAALVGVEREALA
jgi:hypothetical protein